MSAPTSGRSVPSAAPYADTKVGETSPMAGKGSTDAEGKRPATTRARSSLHGVSTTVLTAGSLPRAAAASARSPRSRRTCATRPARISTKPTPSPRSVPSNSTTASAMLRSPSARASANGPGSTR
jgi:hypothetical protein